MCVFKKNKGYVLINVMLILLLCSLFSLCFYKIITNNIQRNNLKYKYSDLNDIGDMEKVISQVNFIVNENNIHLDEIENTGEVINLDNEVVLTYDKGNDRYSIVDTKSLKREVILNYKKNGERYYLIPYENKY